MDKCTVKVVGCTNRAGSLTKQLADFYAHSVCQEGHTADVLCMDALPPAFVSQSLYVPSSAQQTAFRDISDAMEQTQKYVFIVPEYNGSFPGVFKAFLDGLRFPQVFKNKKCALVGVSAGTQGASLALSHLTDIFHHAQMHVYPLKLRLGSIKDSRLETVLSHPTYPSLLQEQIKGILSY